MPKVKFQGYTKIITPAMYSAARANQDKYLLQATELLANVKAILIGADVAADLSRAEFLTTSYLLEMVDNNLHKLPLDLVTNLGAETYATKSGKHKSNTNLTRNITAHILNLEHCVDMHSEGLRAQWLDEFFAEDKLFDVLLDTLESYNVITDRAIFELDPTILATTDSNETSEAAAGAGGAGAGSGSAHSMETLVTKYSAALPKLVDHTAGKRGKTVEAAFINHTDSLLQLLNYHIQLAQHAHISASGSIVAMSEFVQAMQVVGNVSKILRVTGGMTDELSYEVDYLCFARNEFAHAKTINKIFALTHTSYISSQIVKSLHNSSIYIQELSTLETAPVIKVEAIYSQDASKLSTQMELKPSSIERGNRTSTQKSHKVSTQETMAEYEALERAIAENMLAMNRNNENDALDLTTKFTAKQQQKIKLAELVLNLVTHALKTGQDITQQLVTLISSEDFDINQTISVAYSAPRLTKKQVKATKYKSQIERDVSLFEGVVRGEYTANISDTEHMQILPLNALLYLVRLTASSHTTDSKYYKIVEEICRTHSLAVSYSQTLDVGLNPCMQPCNSFTVLTQSSEYVRQFSIALHNKHPELHSMPETAALSSFVFKYIINKTMYLTAIKQFGDMNKSAIQQALTTTIILDDLDSLKMLIKQLKIDRDIDATIEGESTLLYYATELGNLQIVRFLIEEHHASMTAVSLPDTDQTMPIYIAASEGHIHILQYFATLSNWHEFVDSTNVNNASPLFIAAQAGHFECVQFLVENGANAKMLTTQRSNALMVAAGSGRTNIVEYLLHNVKIDINVQDLKKMTALHNAVIGNHIDIMRCLVKYGAKLDLLEHQGCSPLWSAVSTNKLEIAEYLIEEGAAITPEGTPLSCISNMTFIHLAQHQYWDMAGLMILHGADINALQSMPIMVAKIFSCAFKNMNLPLIEHLVQQEGMERFLPLSLQKAAEYGWFSVIQSITDRLDNLSSNDIKAIKTAFKIAAKNGNLKIIEHLSNLQNDSEEYVISEKIHESALRIAADEGNIELVQYFIRSGVDIYMTNKDGKNAIDLAKASGHMEIVQYLTDPAFRAEYDAYTTLELSAAGDDTEVMVTEIAEDFLGMLHGEGESAGASEGTGSGAGEDAGSADIVDVAGDHETYDGLE